MGTSTTSERNSAELGALIVVGGPTAVGKTKVAATLGLHFDTEVISADSRQFYGAMRIGTARPDPSELLGVPHHFLGHLELDVSWSAGDFARAAETVLRSILERKGIAIVVGGSGLYLDALIKGLDPLPPQDVALRNGLRERLERHGIGHLLEELDHLDPVAGTTIDRANPQRVIRALEICLLSGKPYSSLKSGPAERKDLRILRLAMERSRPELYARIDTRVDRMIEQGLEAEARALLPFRTHNALRTVGYTELFSHFDGKCTRAEAIAAIKQHSRNFAKRQGTWLRRESSWVYFHPREMPRMIERVAAMRP